VAEKTDLIFNISLFFWNILTFGYIPHILITICIIAVVFTIVFLLTNTRLFSFLIRDRIKFAKQYSYTFIYQKVTFAKNFFKIIWRDLNKSKLFFILGSIIAMIGLAIYLFMRYGA